MKARLTSSGIWPLATLSRVAGPSFWITWPSADSTVTVPGRLKELMWRTSGRSLSKLCTSKD